MGRTIKNQIPWTRDLYDQFINDAILTELEKKVLHARIWEKDKWTIVGMAMEFHVSKSTINNCISSIRCKLFTCNGYNTGCGCNTNLATAF